MLPLNITAWFSWKSWGLAFALATGAFWLVMVKDPPKSEAADPTSFSIMDMKVPSDLPLAEGGNAY